MELVVQRLFMPEEKRSDSVIARAEKGLVKPLTVLDQHLEGREWLVGDAFSIADLNLAGVTLLLDMVGFDVSPFTNVHRWREACKSRPALARARNAGS